jgi:zinc transport system substrate-binding protein
MRLLSAVLLASACLTVPGMAAPAVVASIKPIHSLVAAVMEGVGEPTLLVKGAASPHTYSLRPSDAGALESADIVFWTGHGMELFLADALETLAADAQNVELAETPGLELLPVREGGTFEAHSHEDEEAHEHEEEGHEHGEEAGEHGEEAHEHEHHDEGEADMHFWLDPENAKLMVGHIADVLKADDPEHAATYASNAEAEIAALDTLQAEVAAALAPVGSKPFLVFHDAYQYFEQRFGLTVAGSVTISPEIAPGAARIDELRAKVSELGATCVFAEPNFEPAIISAVTEGTEAKAGVLDPEGGALTEGPELYGTLLRGLAASVVECLH